MCALLSISNKILLRCHHRYGAVVNGVTAVVNVTFVKIQAKYILLSQQLAEIELLVVRLRSLVSVQPVVDTTFAHSANDTVSDKCHGGRLQPDTLTLVDLDFFLVEFQDQKSDIVVVWPVNGQEACAKIAGSSGDERGVAHSEQDGGDSVRGWHVVAGASQQAVATGDGDRCG
ncbi:hypothetical protein PHYPSEUDO_004922 [Phytophthora pseudosyringae]|uniref:Uncharacterized protein n=1 Tax=Phytophthora pseudosyringae TaxID=221518 RepID=A0A8T1WCI2_9STRA|nr:hypothetical protein PHYPSEUDO_004922 [Phytophthora pseudosyringae]